MRRHLRAIVNPVSGRGRARKRARHVLERLRAEGFDIEILETRGPGHAQELAARPGADVVIAVGGDGTVNEIVNGLREPFPVLGLIPSGTGNTLAKELRMPRSVEGVARVLRGAHESLWDWAVERGSGQRFLLFLSAGYDAYVVHRFHAQRSGTIYQWEYFLWGLKSVVEFQVPRIGVEIDDVKLTESASWVQVSNVAAYGGPLVFTPKARPDDARLEVMVYHAPWRRDTVRMFFRSSLCWLTGYEYAMHDLTFHSARRVRFWSADDRPVPIQIDGDPGGLLPAEIELVPGAVRVLTP